MSSSIHVITLLICLFFCVFGHSQTDEVSYGITDYSVSMDTPVNLIIRCDEGIDSVDLNLDTNVFRASVSYYDSAGWIFFRKKTEKVIAYQYRLRAKDTGAFKLNDMTVWSQGEAHTLTFEDSIYVSEAIAVQSKPDFTFEKFFNSSDPRPEDFTDSISQDGNRINVWFEQKSYSKNDTISLFLLTNKTKTEFPEEIELKRCSSLPSPVKKNQIKFEDGERTELSLMIFKFMPEKSGKVKLNPIEVKIDGELVRSNKATCKIK